MQANLVEPDVGEVQIVDDHLVAWRLESHAIPRLAAVESCERDVAYASLALATWGCRMNLSDPMQQSSPFVSTAMVATHTYDDQQFDGSHSSSRMGCSFLHNSVGWSESKSRVQGSSETSLVEATVPASTACGREVLVGCRKADHGIQHGALADFLLQEACVTREAEVVPTDCAATVRAASDGHRPDKGRGPQQLRCGAT